MRKLSIFGYAGMVGGLIALLLTHRLFSRSPIVILLQTGAVVLMLWARITFGRRSFHLSANTTEGELVTTGPFRYVRNPIYCAVCLFTWTGAFAHFSWPSMTLAALILLSALARIYSEETFLEARYPGYTDYAARTHRLIPFVF